jgi:maltose/maltodextrin transport system permease protein
MKKTVGFLIGGAFFLAAAALACRMSAAGAGWWGWCFPAAVLFVSWVYGSGKTHASRYLLPGLTAFALFVLLPLLYTVFIAFTNFSGSNLFSRAQVDGWFAAERYAPRAERFSFALYGAGEGKAVLSCDCGEGRRLNSDPFPLDIPENAPPVALALGTAPPSGEPFGLKDLAAARGALARVSFRYPGESLPLRPLSLRSLGWEEPMWRRQDDGTLLNAADGRVLAADEKAGVYRDRATGKAEGPGWRVVTGFANFRSILADPRIRSPFLRIFGWNLAFAFLSVFLTFAVGVALASLLQWPALKGRGVYRTLLMLPYAIPAFIPILVFKGLFNEGFGEINMVLRALFGTAPAWFTNPWWARTMILLVNLWLGYPYMMIISSGMLQAVPTDIYEASSIDGAGAWTNFFRLTLPQILPPLFPLLVASFAFNFNNFTLIYLLTGGMPAIAGSATVAGATDLLVSYTYRAAFRDSAAQMGFASAVATLLFIVVGLLAWWQIRLTKAASKGPQK